MPAQTSNSLYYLNPEWSAIERKVLNDCVDFLIDRGFEYRQVPSSVDVSAYLRQGIYEPDGTPIMGDAVGDTPMRLTGSAEQGILDMYTNARVDEETRIVALNTCFRSEPHYLGLKSVREFQKVEQYVFTNYQGQSDNFERILTNALDYLHRLGLDKDQIRVVNTTDLDPGYHMLKKDIEVYTRAYGWLETHSCSLFGQEQSRRYGISGEYSYTLSNTGIASPRILVPLMEKEGIDLTNV